MTDFPILYQDPHLVVIDKPVGYHVHPPEVKPEKVPREKIILYQLRGQVGTHVYPVHRLDVSTSGLLAFALHSEAASFYGQQFQQQQIQKKYWAVVRGFTPSSDVITLPLESENKQKQLQARTEFRTLKKIEIDAPIGNRHAIARYSWLEVSPRTGRFHQIRRHFNRISHPLIGDATHGDSRHNRFFREQLGIAGLCLRAIELQLPIYGGEGEIQLSVGLNPKWEKLEELFAKSALT
jgi:tRNA pseudouridine65 synthase